MLWTTERSTLSRNGLFSETSVISIDPALSLAGRYGEIGTDDTEKEKRQKVS